MSAPTIPAKLRGLGESLLVLLLVVWFVALPAAVVLSLVLAALGVDFARGVWGFDG